MERVREEEGIGVGVDKGEWDMDTVLLKQSVLSEGNHEISLLVAFEHNLEISLLSAGDLEVEDQCALQRREEEEEEEFIAGGNWRGKHNSQA
jgi:hypothetical protein